MNRKALTLCLKYKTITIPVVAHEMVLTFHITYDMVG